MLLWLPELSMGVHTQETPPDLYGEAYYKEYALRSSSPMGKKLTQARCAMIQRHMTAGLLFDIGSGMGDVPAHLLQESDIEAYGEDINPHFKKTLHDRGLTGRQLDDPSTNAIPHTFQNYHGTKAISFFDSLEHLDSITPILDIPDLVFASLPILPQNTKLTSWKHYKPGEHHWYWSYPGFTKMMRHLGFTLLETNATESHLGRQDVLSFAFKKNP